MQFAGKMLQKDEKNHFCRHNYPSWVIENIFRIMVTIWRIFYTPINASVENIKKIT